MSNIAEDRRAFTVRHPELAEKWGTQASNTVTGIRELVADLRTLRPGESKEQALAYYLLDLFERTQAVVQGKTYDPKATPDTKLVEFANVLAKPAIQLLGHIFPPGTK